MVPEISFSIGWNNWNPHLCLQLFQPIERSSGAILELGDHRRSRLIVLIRSHSFRLLGREHLAARAAT